METLSDELLGAVFSFLPSVKDLKTLAQSNRRIYSLLISSKTGDGLFRDLYQHHYPRSEQCCDRRVSGRQLWQDTYFVYRSITQEGIRDHHHHNPRHGRARPSVGRHAHPQRRRGREHAGSGDESFGNRATEGGNSRIARSSPVVGTVASQPLNTVEILPPDEEAEAILYDNHDYDASAIFSDRQPCVGYFGLQPLLASAAQPADGSAMRANGVTPIAVWGDFSGLRVAPCWDALLNSRSTHRDRMVSIHDEKQSQVMDLKIHPNGDAMIAQGYTSPFFLGFASGVVMAVAARDDELKVLSTSTAHTSEVTALAIVPPYTKNDAGYLLSVCVEGDVYLYPNSLTKLCLATKICISPPSIPKISVFSMSATLFGEKRVVLCLGGQGLKISLWQLEETKSKAMEIISLHEFEYEPHISFGDQDLDNLEEDQTDHNITHVSFVGPIGNGNNNLPVSRKKDLLVMGTSRGHIVTWDLQGHVEDPHRPELRLYTSHERVHTGGVESTQRIGNMLLTTGGNDGVIKAMNLASGLPLANILVHPGRLLAPPAPALPVRLKCAVVKSWVCHERQSIIGFCRDGHITEWSYQLHQLMASPPSIIQGAAVGGSKKNGRVIGKKDRASSDGALPTGKRQRRKGPPKKIVEPFSCLNNDMPAVGAASASMSASVTAELMARTDTKTDGVAEFGDIHSLLAALPREVTNVFSQLGFCKLNHLHRPVLVLSPLSVPTGPIRDAWFCQVNAYVKCQRMESGGDLSPPCIVHWLGNLDPKRAYSVVAASKVMSYERGVTKNYHQIPLRFKERLEKGETLKRYEQQYLDGIGLLQLELAKKPESRSHLLEHFVKDESRFKVGPSERES